MTQPFDAKTYWETRLAERYDLQGVGDIGLPVAYNEYLYRVRASAFGLVTRMIGSDFSSADILDVGSGTGFYIEQWLQRSPRSLVGLEITDTAVLRLTEHFATASFMQCDIGQQMPQQLAGATFDVVTAYDMLFHIVDDAAYARAFQNFAGLVKPGGHLVFSDNLARKAQSHGAHQLSRAEADVFDLLQRNGFTLQRIVPMFVLMNDPVRSRSRLLRRLFGRIYRIASAGERQGRLTARVLFPLELALIRLLRRGPSTEIFVCRRNES